MTDNINFSVSPDESVSSMRRIAHAGIVFDAQNVYSRSLLKSFLRAAKPLDIPLAIVGLDKEKSRLPELGIPFIPCTSKDFSLWGNLKSGQILAFTQKPFALYIDMSLSQNQRIKKINSLSRAKFKAGINKTTGLFDLSFSMPVSEEENPEAFRRFFDLIGKIEIISHPKNIS